MLYIEFEAVLKFYNLEARSMSESCSLPVLDTDTDYILYRGSYISTHILLNLLNELGKIDKMRGLSSILTLYLQ